MRFSHSLFVAVIAPFVGLWCIALSCSAAGAASFDCTKAIRAVDKMICSNADLSSADSALAAAYKTALAHAGSDQDRTTLRNSQRLWLQRRDAKCLRMVPGAAAECLKGEYATRLAELKDSSPPAAANVAAFIMADGALAAAHPKERPQLEFPQGAFSPSGKLFAFGVSQIVSGDMDQAWLYSLRDKKLVPATVSPVQGKTEVTISGFAWIGDTLYVQGTKGAQGDAQSPFVRAVTMGGARDIAAMPKIPSAPGVAQDTTAAVGDDLSDQGDKREEDAHFSVTSKNTGHGALTLTAHDKTTKHDFTIATGTWNLGGFVFDAPRARVIYANGNGGIDIYSLTSRRTVATLPVAVNALLDVSADGTLAAYSAIGGCETTTPGQRQAICFVKLPV